MPDLRVALLGPRIPFTAIDDIRISAKVKKNNEARAARELWDKPIFSNDNRGTRLLKVLELKVNAQVILTVGVKSGKKKG